MKELACLLPDSLHQALERRMDADRTTCSDVVTMALSRYLEKPIHTLFQVSTSAALVEGLYQGAVTVGRLLRHGDFGLGTFVDLDGEMILLDGTCYRVAPDGAISIVEPERFVPYAVVTAFRSESRWRQRQVTTFLQLTAACERLRCSDNVYYAFRVTALFQSVEIRVVRPPPTGAGLQAVATTQRESTHRDVRGTLVGLWSPAFAGTFSVPGYHFHFLSADHRRGGHLLECRASDVTVEGCSIREMHVSLPETEEFLRADLSRDPTRDLLNAESSHDK
jgi:acetolactate decarboxylase